ncbi:MAG TPA: MJ0042-type zinc finger domain-containing protein [Brevundimonas sp.]|jgi:predicted Zn finger-like uncharacterized protein|uniref:MJ0042-type zinc finger domain-containing protein n=1 Tax=Brevundimonas sp. TaxID=1871086 RepID=UPI002DE7629D|nr:MJ0042-type zinc finger domain-containing protein [Brevundimonas sp.]
MILTCPSCATGYFAPDDAIGPLGRTVRCQSCKHTWKALPEEPLDLTAAATPVVAAPPAAVVAPEVGPETLAETPAPELPKAYRARAEQQRRLRRAAAHGVAWAGTACVALGMLGAAWLFRADVVDVLPRTASAYAAVGVDVNPVGLDFEALNARAAPDDPTVVIVSGAVRNVRDDERVVPTIRVALLDREGLEVAHDFVRLDAPPVLPGKVQGFAVRLSDPGGRAQEVATDFAPDAPPAPKKAASPAPVARPLPRADAPAHVPATPLAAARPALRPALSPVATGGDAPVDAVPLDEAHAEAPLTSAHG